MLKPLAAGQTDLAALPVPNFLPGAAHAAALDPDGGVERGPAAPGGLQPLGGSLFHPEDAAAAALLRALAFEPEVDGLAALQVSPAARACSRSRSRSRAVAQSGRRRRPPCWRRWRPRAYQRPARTKRRRGLLATSTASRPGAPRQGPHHH